MNFSGVGEKERNRMISCQIPKVISVLVMTVFTLGTFGQEGTKQGVREGFRSVNETSLYFRIEGEGDPVVVLHGGPGMSHEYLVPHLSALADRHQLIFYDQRASGNSPIEVAPESVNIENFVRDLEGIRASFKIERVTLLGHSWGGLLALHYAASFPERTGRLILVDPAPPNSELDAMNFKIRAERLSREDSEILDSIRESEAFKRLEPESLKEYLQISERARFSDPERISELTMDLDEEKIKKLMWVGQLMTPCLDDYDIGETLKTISCPTLIIHGDYDPIPLESSEIIHRSIRGSELVVIEGCGHFPFIEAPQIFARAVEDFLERTSE